MERGVERLEIETVEQELTFLGLVAMMDPPHREVPDAILKCRQAGVRVIMLTGDDAKTAKAVGDGLGLDEVVADVLPSWGLGELIGVPEADRDVSSVQLEDMMDALRSRLPWLGVNVITAMGAALVVRFFAETINVLPVLAAWMPVVAGMGGNTGTQALAVTVRRLALSPESSGRRWEVIGKELLVGIFNGFAIGIVVAALSLLLDRNAMLGLVVMAAKWMNLIVAGFAGAFVPIVLERVGVDPAVASSVFVTTFTDLCGFFLLLGLATTLLL